MKPVGVQAVIDTIEHVGREHNPDLDILGAVVNRAPAKSAEAERQEAELERVLGRRTVWRPFIPQRMPSGPAYLPGPLITTARTRHIVYPTPAAPTRTNTYSIL